MSSFGGGLSCLSCPGSRSCDPRGKCHLLKKQTLSIYLNYISNKKLKRTFRNAKVLSAQQGKILTPPKVSIVKRNVKGRFMLMGEIDLSESSPGMTKTELSAKGTIIALIRFHTVKRVNMLCSDGRCN